MKRCDRWPLTAKAIKEAIALGKKLLKYDGGTAKQRVRKKAS